MLNYLRQHKIFYIIFILLLIIAIVVNSNGVACICLSVAQFMFLIELVSIDTYFEKSKKHHLRVARKILIFIGTTYLFIGLLILLVYLYKLNHLNVYGNLFLGCGIVLILLLIIRIILKCIIKTPYYQLILTIRYIWQLFKTGAVVYALFFITIICLSGVLLFTKEEFLFSSNPFFSSYVTITYLTCEFLLAFMGYKYIKELPKQTLFYFKKDLTILYLRNFDVDNSILNEKCLADINTFKERHNYNFIKVGNPNSLFEIDSYYLPTTNWQYHVKKMIQFHKVIFVILAKTKGVTWEVINHEEFWSKYIFYVPDITTLDYWIELTTNEGNIKLANTLKSIELTKNGVAFSIEENIIYYTESIYDVFLAHEKGYYKPSISYIKNNINWCVKLSANHTIYLYNQQQEVIATIDRAHPYYLPLEEYHEAKFYKQKFSKQYKRLSPIYLVQFKDKPIIPIHIPTSNLFKIYYWEYRYPRLILEPMLMFLCILGIDTPLSILSFIFFIIVLLLLVSNICLIIPIELLTLIKNKSKKQLI